MERDGILIFHSIHRVMKAEKALKRAGLDIRLVPVPRQLSSDCGLSIAFRLDQRDAVEAELEAVACPWEEIHASDGKGGYRRTR